MNYYLNLISSLVLVTISFTAIVAQPRPNIIFILSDDLSWGDLGSYGQKKIKTPSLDRLANEGMRFTQAYAGNAVCAPSRSCLMQGKHPGHARVRGNSYHSYRESLQTGDYTVATMLREAGYRTGLFGKWGLANHNQPGVPNKMGFDEFYGYLNQRHAHCYYPEFLYRNEERIYFPENGVHHKYENYAQKSSYDQEGHVLPIGIDDARKAKYSFDVYCEQSLNFVRDNHKDPFFMYLAYTTPHGPLIVPELGIYRDYDWEIQYKEWAAMVSRMDAEVGRIMNLLDELGLSENTLIIFASDNGDSSHGYEGRYSSDTSTPTIAEFFNSQSPTRGRKGDSYDGAFHVPALAWWPGQIAPLQVSDHLWAFWDFLPTVADILDITPSTQTDGISFLPTLTGEGTQQKHEYLYWEFDQAQAVRSDNWFAHRASEGKIELYDLVKDPQQSKDLSASYPEMVRKMEDFMKRAHVPSTVWPSPGESLSKFSKRLAERNISVRPDNIADF